MLATFPPHLPLWKTLQHRFHVYLESSIHAPPGELIRFFGAYAAQVQAMSSGHGVPLPCSGPGNTSTSDEAGEHQPSLVDERRRRKMISNRESARRSRMRKQWHLDELWSQVVHLRATNRRLIDEINHLMEEHDRILQENAWLRQEASDLRKKLDCMQVESTNSASRAPYET